MIGKAELILSGSFEYEEMCLNGQVKTEYYDTLFAWINLGLPLDVNETTLTDEDIETGFMIFSAVIYCSESVQLSKFLHNLVSTQSPRTIIQATVNTIQSDNIREIESRQLLNEFYQALDQVFDLQYGKILMALSSTSQLQDMMSKSWPYFHNFSCQEMDQCLSGLNCEIVQKIGKLLILFILNVDLAY